MKKIIGMLILLATIVLLFSINVHADTEPTPTLRVIVKNDNTKGNYYLDLLVQDQGKIKSLTLNADEKQKVSKLANYNELGWRPALLGGTDKLMTGTLQGILLPDGSYLHEFRYGVPTDFKILVLKNGELTKPSKEIKRDSLEMTVTYDMETGAVNASSYFASTMNQIILRLILAMMILLVMAVAFGFTLSASWKVLVFTNIFFQGVINAIIYFTEQNHGINMTLIVYCLATALITVICLFIYSFALKEKTVLTRVYLALFSNLAAFGAGIVPIVFRLVTS